MPGNPNLRKFVDQVANKDPDFTAVKLLPILPLGDDADVCYWRLRTDLKRRGTRIGANDMLIAAHTLSLGATLVNDNMREFERVTDLAVVNRSREAWAICFTRSRRGSKPTQMLRNRGKPKISVLRPMSAHLRHPHRDIAWYSRTWCAFHSLRSENRFQSPIHLQGAHIAACPCGQRDCSGSGMRNRL